MTKRQELDMESLDIDEAYLFDVAADTKPRDILVLTPDAPMSTRDRRNFRQLEITEPLTFGGTI
jgi:hypothetical protein